MTLQQVMSFLALLAAVAFTTNWVQSHLWPTKNSTQPQHIQVSFMTTVSMWGQTAADPPFLWGSATASYQVEGFRNVSGRQPSVWDCFDTFMSSANGVDCASIQPSKPNGQANIRNHDNAADAVMDYQKYPETISLLTSHGFGAYRMSISWSRVLSYELQLAADGTPTLTSKVNWEGVEHYRQVLAALAAADIEVALTMWHWDTPQQLENAARSRADCIPKGSKIGSAWLCPDIADEFERYAKVLLAEFGPLVRYWITLNEPLTIISIGYATPGIHAPGRCSDRAVCFDGNDRTEPFLAAHNLLRAHAKAFRLWQQSTNVRKDSICGVVLNGDMAFARDPASAADKQAAQTSMEYQTSIFFDPIYYGKWPVSVAAGVGSNLPVLDAQLIRGTHAGVYFQNHYTSFYSQSVAFSAMALGYMATANVSNSGYGPSGVPIGLPSSNGWLFSYPPGLAAQQNWLSKRYPGVAFVVTENGWGNDTTTLEQDLNDLVRCNYYRSYIGNMSAGAYQNGVRVLGYFAWSILDNYEWADGYSTRFGLTYVDYQTQVRTPKLSLQWFGEVTRKFSSLPKEGQDAFSTCESIADAAQTGNPQAARRQHVRWPLGDQDKGSDH
eukprot:g41344.t1